MQVQPTTRTSVVHLCFNTCTARGDLLHLRNRLYLRHLCIRYTTWILCIYYLHTFKTCRTSNNFVLQMPQHKKKISFDSLLRTESRLVLPSYPVLSCICTTRPTKVQLDVTPRNGSRTSSFCIGTYAGVKASLLQCKYIHISKSWPTLKDWSSCIQISGWASLQDLEYIWIQLNLFE